MNILDINNASKKVDLYCKNNSLSSSMITIHNALLVAACNSLKIRGIEPNVLEIGTYDGINAKLLAKISPPISITTYDLPPNDDRILAHNPLASDINVLKKLYLKRILMASDESIHYREESSTQILLTASKYSFNLVWVDGDHSFPQVAFDISAGLYFLGKNKDALMLCDDVFPSEDDPSWRCLRNIKKDTDYHVTLFQKRPCGEKCVALIYRKWPYYVD